MFWLGKILQYEIYNEVQKMTNTNMELQRRLKEWPMYAMVMGIPWQHRMFSPTEFKIFHFVFHHPGMTMMVLTERVGMAHTNTLVHVKALESKGMIKRERKGKFIYLRHTELGVTINVFNLLLHEPMSCCD